MEILIALIGAAAVVTAAWIGTRARRKEVHEPPTPTQSVHSISQGSTVILSGRDSHVVQQAPGTALSEHALAVVRKAADELIPDRDERRVWGYFNAGIWKDCFQSTPGGVVLDYTKFQERVLPENRLLLKKSAEIYLKASKQIPDTGRGDGDIILRLATLYTKAALKLHGLSAEATRRERFEDFAPLWNGTEEGWVLVRVPEPPDPRFRFGIFNVPRQAFERIDDLDLHERVVARMLEEHVSVMEQFE